MPAELLSAIASIEEHGIVDPSLRRQLEESGQAMPDRASAIREWVRRGLLTPYQANLVNQNKTAELVVGPYVLLDRIGQGGMGDVFRARHCRLRTRTAALKVIRPDRLRDAHAAQPLMARFEREPETLARLSHRNIVQVFDAGKSGDTLYLAMEHLEGTTLEQKAKDRPLGVREACEAIAQTAEGLRHLDAQGLVHRDIKPANLFLTADGTVKILDLGLVLVRNAPGNLETVDELTAHGGGLGTPAYWAPEQATHPHGVDHRADIYSLGRTFYYLLAGRLPPLEPTPIAANAIQAQRPDVPKTVAHLIERMTAWDRADRPKSAQEVLDALARFLARRPPAKRSAWILPTAIGGAVAGISAVVLGAILFARGSDPKRNVAPDGTPDDPAPIVAGIPPLDPKPQAEPWKFPKPKPEPAKKEVAPPPPEQPVEPAGALGKSRLLPGHSREVVSVAFIPGKPQALSCSSEEVVWWDLQRDVELKRRGSSEPLGPSGFSNLQPGGGFDRKSIEDSLAERSPLGAVAALPDGTNAILGGMSHLTLWDLDGWKKRKAFARKHCGVIGASVAISGDGRVAAHGNWDSLIKVFDLAKLEEMPRSFPGSIASLSRDGKLLLAGTRSQLVAENVHLRLFDLDSGQLVKSFAPHRQGVHATALSPDGKRAVSAPMHGSEAILWSLETYEEVRRFKGHKGPILSVAFSSDGTRLLTGSEDATARLWNVADGAELDRFDSHAKAVQAAAFSPGGNYAITGSSDQMIGIWQLKK